MFYIAEAFLWVKGWPSQGIVPACGLWRALCQDRCRASEFHRYLIRGMEVRHAGDYGRGGTTVTPQKHRSKSPMRKSFSLSLNASSGLSRLLTSGIVDEYPQVPT
jgi:hypothetical protein